MRFFFYGTLIPGSGNPVSEALGKLLVRQGPATARGRLYAIPDKQGHYPALLPGKGSVHGLVFATLPGFDRSDLARMDAYEEFHPGNPVGSIYLRRKVAIRLMDGEQADVQAYIFNRALPAGAQIIADGNFPAWLSRAESAAFGTKRPVSRIDCT